VKSNHFGYRVIGRLPDHSQKDLPQMPTSQLTAARRPGTKTGAKPLRTAPPARKATPAIPVAIVNTVPPITDREARSGDVAPAASPFFIESAHCQIEATMNTVTKSARNPGKPTKTKAPAKAAATKVAQKVKRRSKNEEDADVKRFLEADGEAHQRVEAEAVEFAKLSPAELVKRWEENERKINRSRRQRDIYNVSWMVLSRRSLKLEDLIARRQSTMAGLIAKLRFLADRIEPDDEICRELAVSCRLDAEAIENIVL
jgi:hypothetical protein